MQLNQRVIYGKQFKTIGFILTMSLIMAFSFPGLLKASNLEDRLAKLEAKLEIELEKTRALNEIANLIAKNQYYQWARMHDERIDLFAMKTPGVKAEIEQFGIYDGPEGIKKMLNMEKLANGEGVGQMVANLLTTPVITVAGDGKTAKGVWLSPGITADATSDGEENFSWRWIRIGADFIKEGGQWKIWHYHLYGWFNIPFYKSSSEAGVTGGPGREGGGPTMPAEMQSLMPDRPNSYSWSYSTKSQTENVPAPPEPYDTWDDSMSYVK